MINGGRFEFALTGRFVLPPFMFLFVLVRRFAFALRLLLFELLFALLFVFLLRLGLFSFPSFVFAGVASGELSGTVTTSELSPSFTPRLISMATVWPALTTSPPRGN
jgi:hypothetical protein